MKGPIQACIYILPTQSTTMNKVSQSTA